MNQIRDNSGKLLADITDFLSESDDFNNTITVNDDNEKKSMAEICSYDFSSDTSLYKGFVGEPAISKELKSSPPGIPKPAIPISPSPLPRISSSQFVVNPLHFVIPDESSSPSIKLNKRPIIGLTRKTIKCFSSSEENNIHKASNSSSWILNSTEWPLSSPSHETDTVISRMTAKVQDNNNKKTPLVMTSPKKNVIDNRIVLQKSPRRSISSFMSPVILPKKEQQNEEQKKVTEGLVKSTKDVSKKRVEPIEQESVANQQQQKRTRLNTIFFTPEQRKILKLVVEQGQNVFFTGAAGTGKSVLLRQIIADMKKKYEYKSFTSFANSTTSLSGTCRVAVTASTGLAACNIGGMTLHSFAGIGLGKEEADVLVKRVRKNKKINKRWKDVKVLIIDEISMIDGTLFDKLDVIARKIRKKPNVPFGGIQIVITGDFYQLPPVPDKGKPVNFTFEAECWSEAITHTIELRQVFRQKDDRFSTMLNEMRNGKMSPGTIHTFQNLSRQPKVPAGITPTHLYPRRFEVEQANKRKLEQLRGGNIVYEAVDTYSSPEIEQIVNLDNMIAVKELSLKRGAQVMMIKNMDETLVNGSLGQVLGLMSESAYMLMQHEITVMSSQEARNVIEDRADALDEKISKIGQTMSVSDDEDCGSSPSSTEGEYDDSVFGIPKSIAELDNDKLNVKWKRKRARLQILQNNSENLGKKYPLVRFYLGDGTTEMF